jgi:UDP-N-acetyl-D-galactosamine dehydrogenase
MELRAGKDRTGEIDGAELLNPALTLTWDSDALKYPDSFVVMVPTPITADHQPDLSMVLEASRTIGSRLSKGDIVVYESTVYPGATEDECVPVLENASGLVNGQDFWVGYSPERINPGDNKHRFETDRRRSGPTYARSHRGGLRVGRNCWRLPCAIYKGRGGSKGHREYPARSERCFHERALGDFSRHCLDTMDVLAAARTKWNSAVHSGISRGPLHWH